MAGLMTPEQRKEQLEKVRQKMKGRGRGRRDPYEFRADRAKDGEELNYYMRILPELDKGEKCEGGLASRAYDFYFYENAAHWIDNKKIECPRVHDGDDCPICELGFDLLNEEKDQDLRKEISRKWLPRTYHALNVYFLNTDKNPEAIRGKSMWFNAPKTVLDIFDRVLHSDDPGDSDEPKAFGFFYDLVEGYTFKLNAQKKGDYNTYEASGFLPRLRPLVVNEDGGADEATIQKILNQRHDLVTKFDDRDMDRIKKVVSKLVSGSDGDFDQDEEKPKEEKKGKKNKKTDEDVVEEPKTSSKKGKKDELDDGSEVKKEPDPAIEDDDPELQELMSKIKPGDND